MIIHMLVLMANLLHIRIRVYIIVINLFSGKKFLWTVF